MVSAFPIETGVPLKEGQQRWLVVYLRKKKEYYCLKIILDNSAEKIEEDNCKPSVKKKDNCKLRL